MTLPAFAAELCAPALLLLVLSAGACCRLLSPACEALSSKPDTHRYCCRTMGQKTDDRSTVSQTPLCILCGQCQEWVTLPVGELGSAGVEVFTQTNGRRFLLRLNVYILQERVCNSFQCIFWPRLDAVHSSNGLWVDYNTLPRAVTYYLIHITSTD